MSKVNSKENSQQIERGGKTISTITGKRVLLIEGRQERLEQIQSSLKKYEIDARTAPSIQNAVKQMMLYTFDVIALDADTQDASHLIELMLDLRHAKNTLVLLFPIERFEIRVFFLNRGFDVCLSEAEPKEVCAAIRALLRRPSINTYPEEATPPGRIIYKDLMLDPLRQKVKMHDTEIMFTSMEFKLLYFLASNPSIVFSKELLYERVWGESSTYGSKGVVDLICSIRRKLKLSAKDTVYIKTIKGTGYCFAP